MSLATEIRTLRALARAPSTQTAITFYAESASYWAYFEGLVEELTLRHEVPVTYVTSDADDALLAEPRPLVHAHYLRHLLPLWLAFCRARVLVMTVMDLGSGPLRRSIHDVQYVYVFHGLGSTHRACRERAFDQYDAIHCVGPHQVREVRRREELAGLPGKQLIEAGYPRLDRIRRARRARPKSRADGPTRVLVAPSWHAHNLVATCGTQLFDGLVATELDVTLRAHPETVRRDPASLERLARRYGPRLRLEDSVLSDDSLLESDVLVTDGSMIALEYAFGVERPVVWIDGPAKVRNPRWRELGYEPLESALRESIGVVVDPADVARLPATIERLVRERGRWSPTLAELARRHVFGLDRAASIGATDLLARAGLDVGATERAGVRP